MVLLCFRFGSVLLRGFCPEAKAKAKAPTWSFIACKCFCKIVDDEHPLLSYSPSRNERPCLLHLAGVRVCFSFDRGCFPLPPKSPYGSPNAK